MGQQHTKPTKLRPGDHIYRQIPGHGYFHHGIYVGDNMVIHLLAPELKGTIEPSPPCEKCGYKPVSGGGGVVKTCLECFICGQILYIQEIVKTPLDSSPFATRRPQEVVDTADRILKNGFGEYDVIDNNCEHFAVYCKTGRRLSIQASGGIGFDKIVGPFVRLLKSSFDVRSHSAGPRSVENRRYFQ